MLKDPPRTLSRRSVRQHLTTPATPATPPTPAARWFAALALRLVTLLLTAGRPTARRLRPFLRGLLTDAAHLLRRLPPLTRTLWAGIIRPLRRVPSLARQAMAVAVGRARRIPPRLSALAAGTARRLHLLAFRVPAVRRRREDRARLHAEAVEARRYADVLLVVTARAISAADRWQRHWQQTEQDAAEAWQAWQDAEERLDRVRAAAAFRTPRTRRTAAEFADREKYLHQAAAAAVERGDLPATVLADLVAGEGGWNPRLHPVEQELVLHRGFAAVRRHLYQRAAAVEETAWHDAQLAAASRDSLRRETAAATTRAGARRHHIQRPPTPSTPHPGTALAPAWSAWRSGWTDTPAVARVR
ncbi:hypothetical protein [Actinoplanes sp. NPDC049802]|uniref:hypothetical protein n=1 Tax=Actinoplanes sp. NPDC049802 TaxID=3154742 RepID=UPI00340A4202